MILRTRHSHRVGAFRRLGARSLLATPFVRSLSRRVLLPLLSLCLSLSVSCATAGPAPPADRLTVATTIFPLYEFTRNVVGEEGDVAILMPPGVEPHEWEPKPSDLALLGRAKAFIYLGPNMEPWAGNVLDSLGKKGPKAIEVGKAIVEQEDLPSLRMDPHFWVDLSKAALAVDIIARDLAAAFPEKAEAFKRNAAAYRARVEELDLRYIRGLDKCRATSFVLGGHSSFAHFAHRFGLEQIAVYDVSPESEPSPRRVASVVQAIRTRGLKVVFFEELLNPRVAEVIAQETGARLLPLNPAGNVTLQRRKRGDTFLSIMEENLANLREGLSCE